MVTPTGVRILVVVLQVEPAECWSRAVQLW